MFAALPIERDLFTFKDLLPGFMYWIASVGGYATVGLVLWFLLGFTMMKRKDRQNISPLFGIPFAVATLAAVTCYGVYIAVLYLVPPPPMQFNVDGVPIATNKGLDWRDVLAFTGGLCACFAVLLPVVRNLGSLSLRRIGALARLSFKEAIRRRVLWVFSILILVFLFASWFVPSKPEHQISTYIGIVDTVMTTLLLFSALLLASFSIPNDIKQQTIHTVLTKPVERFEIVLGRFLGYSALLSIVLVVMTAVSLIYLVWEVDPDAAAESLKARDPVWGELSFEGTGNDKQKGINVGKEWDYRSYISGQMPGQPTNEAIWDLPSVSPALGDRTSVRCEYAFDVFRSTKGAENKGISIGLYFRTWHYVKGNEKLYQKELEERRHRADGQSEDDMKNELSAKYGYYEVPSTRVSSGHTSFQDLPGGLFKSINAGPDPARKQEYDARKQQLLPLEVRVQCHSATQYVGMAKHDFWLRQDDPGGGHDKLWFAFNFFKAQAVNLWLKLILVTGVSVALSTYLSGVISLLVGIVLYIGGHVLPFVQAVAYGRNYGGGPLRALLNLVERKLPGQESGPQDSLAKVVLFSDDVARFGLRLVLGVFPDVARFDFFTRFVEEGFNIPSSQIAINFLLMAAYVLPWLVLAFYLMKWKEVASAT